MKYDLKEINLTGFNPLIDILLDSNNISDDEKKQLFQSELYLSTSKADCVINAVERIKKAKENNELVFVGGDYDADGICATTIMKDALDKLGIRCGYYIPDRFKEGYGLNKNTVQLAFEKGYSLIITVDNGVKAFEALECAKNLGIDVIITDHHLIEEKLDFTCVHPDYMESKFKSMCGAGVALQISRNLIGEYDFHTALACIATIGDVMPILNENRNIIKHGLKILNKHIYKVFDLLIDKKDINVMDISYSIVPKLNALGRLSDKFNPNDIIRYYFLEKDIKKVILMSDLINRVNKLRKDLSNKMSDLALSLIDDDNIIILENKDFHEGIVGLVAGKISNMYNKPSIILNNHNGILKGSARSIEGFNLHEYLKNNYTNYLSFGGHSQAVGLSIKEEDFEYFKDLIKENYKNVNNLEIKKTVYKINIESLSLNNVKELFLLEPFGQGIKFPLIYVEDLNNIKYSLVKNIYPKYVLNEHLEAICFEKTIDNKVEKPNMIIGNITLNNFKGKESVSINIKDIE